MSGQGVAGIFASLAMIISLAVTNGLIWLVIYHKAWTDLPGGGGGGGGFQHPGSGKHPPRKC